MLYIADYQIREKLYQGRHSAIYRAIKQNEQQSVIIKVLDPAPSSELRINKLRQEFEICQRINSKHVVKYLELKPDTTYGYLLIEEDDHAETLLHYIPKTGFAPLTFLNIAIQLAEGLSDIHHCRVIHKDIKPENIIYRPDTGQVKYIDFNNASSLHQHQPAAAAFGLTTEGTLNYISPEQTGRINRMIDHRTDFYSLGVTFYQLLCGKLPFDTEKTSELVYFHLAKQPLAPNEVKVDIPKPLSDIILKLMQKDVEARYQSAYGLLCDLKRCLQELIQKGEITPFPLAQQDIPEYFRISQKLYGRESEISLLTQAYHRASQGRAEIIMVAGPAGSGKTVLAQEIQSIILPKHGLFLMGKFEALKRDIAYSAITQALQAWLKQLITCNEEEILAWKSQLLAALGNQAQLLIDIIPDLEWILGKQPSVSILNSEATKQRFHWLFQQLILVLAQQNHPLIMFLDDWQWADAASLGLLETLMVNPDMRNMLLVGTYRDNEMDITNPSLIMLTTLQKAGVTIQTLSLSPLKVTAVNQWIAETMHCLPETSLPLTTLIYQKTGGFPFFIKIFLQMLSEQGLLIFVKIIGSGISRRYVNYQQRKTLLAL